MSTATTPTPNHHADHPGFSGVGGLLLGLTMTIGRGAVSRLAADLTGVTGADHVVDVGCGPGSAARAAAKRGARVTGVDPAPVMLQLARRLTHGVSVTWAPGAAEALPLPDDSASVLWSLASVHHWPELDAGLAEARRVLVSGGRLLAIERRTHAGATGIASHGWTGDQADAFAERCRAAGFTDVRAERHDAGRHHVWSALAVNRQEMRG